MSAQRSVAGVLLIDVRPTPVLIIVAVKVPIGGDSLLMFCGQPVLPNGLGARFFILVLFMYVFFMLMLFMSIVFVSKFFTRMVPGAIFPVLVLIKAPIARGPVFIPLSQRRCRERQQANTQCQYR